MELPPHRPLTIAHRAGNHLPAIRQALDAGVDILECDVWLHRGRLEVRHTKSLWPLPFRYDRWMLEGIWRRAPLLHEVLEALPPGAGLMIDLKGRAPGLPAAVIEAVQPYVESHRILVCGQTWPLLAPFALRAGIIVAHSVGRGEQLAAAWDKLAPIENDAVSIHRKLLDAEVVAKLKSVASLVISWPINDEDALNEVTGWGVDGVTSDNMDLLRGVGSRRAQSTAR